MKKPKPLTNKAGDVRPLTRADIQLFRPLREVDPELAAAVENGTLRYRGQRGKQKEPVKVATSLRLSPEVISFFKAKGAGWQTRIDDVLKMFVAAAE